MPRTRLEKWDKNWTEMRRILVEKGPLRSDELKEAMSGHVSESTFKRMTRTVRESKIEDILYFPYEKAVYYLQPWQASLLVKRIIKDWEDKQRDIRLQIRRIEKHTDEVHDFLNGWIQQIPEVSLEYQCEEGFLPRNTGVFTDALTTTWDCVESIELEESDFINNCIGFHGDLGRDIILLWRKFKEGMKTFAEEKEKLISEIKKSATGHLNLKYSRRGNEAGFTSPYAERLYSYVISWGEKNKGTLETLERTCERQSLDMSLHVKYLESPNSPALDIWVRLPGSGEGAGSTGQDMAGLDGKILAELRNSLSSVGSKIADMSRKIEGVRLSLVKKMNQLLCLPMIPGICPLLRQSMSK